MPIKIDFLANVRDFLRGTDDAEEALDDVADSLDDMADAAKKGGREAERSVDDLEDSFRDAARRAKDLGDAGKDAGRDVDRGMRDAEDGVEGFKDEANSTARETAASFDGSAESIGDAFQEIAANAFASFGPAGAVAGLAAAAGIGLAVAGFEAADEAAQASKERANEWADAYIEAGGRVLTFDQTMAKILDITTNHYDEASEKAKIWGVSVETAIAAMAGSESAIHDINDSIDDQRVAAEKAADADAEFEKQWNRSTNQGELAQAQYENSRNALDELRGEMSRGGEQASVYSRLLTDTARATEGATEKTDEFGDTVISLPDGKQVYIDAETGQATEDVDAIKNKIYSIPNKTSQINVRANLGSATDAYDRWIRNHNGRSIKIYGKYISPPGSDIYP